MGSENSYDHWLQKQNDIYRQEQEKRLCDETSQDVCLVCPQNLKAMKSSVWSVAYNVTLRYKNEESHIHAIKKVLTDDEDQDVSFIPVRFLFRNKLTRKDRLLAAFDALVLSRYLRTHVSQCHIVHGEQQTLLKIKADGFVKQVRAIIGKINQILASEIPPDLFLGRRCVECQFLPRCSSEAGEKDDLSLLAGMTEKERMSLRSRGNKGLDGLHSHSLRSS